MRVAVIGAGPIGIEAALAAREAGHEVTVYEQGDVGQAVRDWSHVRLFTPWRMNTTSRGRALAPIPDLDACPTGAEFVDQYLMPVSRTLDVCPHHQLIGAARGSLRKTEAIGGSRRTELPFQLLFETSSGERSVEADALLDCTGVVGQPNPVGVGGIPAVGERQAARAGRVLYGIHCGHAVQGQRVAVLGAGATGSTLVLELAAAGREVTWLTGDKVPAFSSPENDVLPERRALWTAAHAASERVRVIRNARVASLDAHEEDLNIALIDGQTLQVDTLVCCTGFRPDLAPTRELQVHHCYASEGPMKLAAALLASSGEGGDCLDQVSQGPEVLRSPEPRFFILGAKSFGRRNDFLLQVGHSQVEDVIAMLR